MQIIMVLIFCLIKSFVQSNFSRGRTLIFPPTAPTRAQLICGIGVPLDLDLEGMTTGYVLKAEYFLPTTAEGLQSTQLHSQPINKRDMFKQHWTNSQKNTEKTSNNIFKLPEYVTMKRSKYRWSVYKSAEKALHKLGFPGKECFLRSICEAAKAAVNFESGLLGELLHILITAYGRVHFYPVTLHSMVVCKATHTQI